ncbi:MAG: hypothetical protein D6798_02360 [Deltaproteobacteria bacterium]|nr:MAG: hypothetical protein D6798_02360 [Deltaproteobacteria bacterium]
MSLHHGLSRLPFQPVLRPLALFAAGYALGCSLAVPLVGVGWAAHVAASHLVPGAPGVPHPPVSTRLASR